jgi:hypothetical protein
MTEANVTILNTDYTLGYRQAKGFVRYTKELLKSLDKPFIFTHNDFSSTSTSSEYRGDEIYSILPYLQSLAGTDDLGKKTLLQFADEDEEWTAERNKDYPSIIYRKVTLKPFAQVLLRQELSDILTLLEIALATLTGLDMTESDDWNQIRDKYQCGKIYHFKRPEAGTDGYFDAEIINTSTGESTRFIQKDIFGVKSFSYPHRVQDSADVLDATKHTDEERNIEKWLSYFGPFDVDKR